MRKLGLLPAWQCGNVHENYESNADSTARLELTSAHSGKITDMAEEETEEELSTSGDSEQSKDLVPATHGFRMLWQCVSLLMFLLLTLPKKRLRDLSFFLIRY